MCFCRAIFRWITAKDLNKIEFSENIDTESPMGLLRGIKFGTETYHNLFKRLCRCDVNYMHCTVSVKVSLDSSINKAVIDRRLHPRCCHLIRLRKVVPCVRRLRAVYSQAQDYV